MATDVTFIILTHNDGKTAINAIKSIKKLKTKYIYDIYVVDNGSKDSTPEMIKKSFKSVKVIQLPKNIGTAGYDKALKKSNSRYIYFTGCDIEVKEDFLDKLVRFLDRNKDVAQVAPQYISLANRNKIDLAGTWLSRAFYSGTFKDGTLGVNPVRIPYIGTGLIRKNILNQFGYLFDNDYFFYGEDVDLGIRLRLIGFKIYYMPSSIVYHAGSISRKIHRPSFLTYLMERNLLRTMLTSLTIKNIIIFTPYVVFVRIVAILRDLIRFRLTDALSRFRALIWVASHLSNIIKKRKKIQAIRIISDKELLKIFTEKYLFRVM
jgi:GT2 family glycosyltransferase